MVFFWFYFRVILFSSLAHCVTLLQPSRKNKEEGCAPDLSQIAIEPEEVQLLPLRPSVPNTPLYRCSNFVPDAEGAGPMNRFFSPVFVAQLNAEEKTLFDNFNSAVSAVEKPTVRLSCKQAGFSEKSLADSESFKQDPLYRLFLNWLALRAWAMSYEQEPITGAVTGDTWK